MAKKGDTVFYLGGPALNNKVQAKVLRAHKDGTCKIEAQCFIHDGGRKSSVYLGYVFDGVHVYPNAKAADDELSARKRFT